MKPTFPFSIVPTRILQKYSQIFFGIAQKLEKNMQFLKLNLEQATMPFTADEYLALSMSSSLSTFIILTTLLTILLSSIVDKPFFLALLIVFPLTVFVFVQQILYPKFRAGRKIRDIDRNLLPALQDILVQLHAGIPLFTILINIAHENYGEVSKEFTKAVKKINSGFSEIDVLDELASKNPSLYFRRTIWQLVNGMKTGSDTVFVIREIITALSEEQLIQIQRYGGQLNPLAMFYMLITVIIPSLGMTFLIIISSFISASEFATKLIFWGLYGFVFFFQIMFLGIIKTKRPTLLER